MTELNKPSSPAGETASEPACDCTWSCMTCEACPNCEGCEHCPKSPESPASSPAGETASEPLRPCPFCGANAFKFTAVGKWKVECSRLDEGCGMETAFWSKESDAISAWNGRSQPTPEAAASSPASEGARFHDDTTPLPCGCPTFYLYVRENNVVCGKCGDRYAHPKDGVSMLPSAAPAAAPESGGNETAPVAELLNSLKVIDRSQRYMECRADLLTQYMYELVRLRQQPTPEPDGWIARFVDLMALYLEQRGSSMRTFDSSDLQTIADAEAKAYRERRNRDFTTARIEGNKAAIRAAMVLAALPAPPEGGQQ